MLTTPLAVLLERSYQDLSTDFAVSAVQVFPSRENCVCFRGAISKVEKVRTQSNVICSTYNPTWGGVLLFYEAYGPVVADGAKKTLPNKPNIYPLCQYEGWGSGGRAIDNIEHGSNQHFDLASIRKGTGDGTVTGGSFSQRHHRLLLLCIRH